MFAYRYMAGDLLIWKTCRHRRLVYWGPDCGPVWLTTHAGSQFSLTVQQEYITANRHTRCVPHTLTVCNTGMQTQCPAEHIHKKYIRLWRHACTSMISKILAEVHNATLNCHVLYCGAVEAHVLHHICLELLTSVPCQVAKGVIGTLFSGRMTMPTLQRRVHDHLKLMHTQPHKMAFVFCTRFVHTPRNVHKS